MYITRECPHCGAMMQVKGKIVKCEYCDCTTFIEDYIDIADDKKRNQDDWDYYNDMNLRGFMEEDEWTDLDSEDSDSSQDNTTRATDWASQIENATSSLSNEQKQTIIYIAIAGACFFLSGVFSLLSLVCLVCIYLAYRSSKQIKHTKHASRSHKNPYPWFLKTGWIICIGMFTGGAFWFVGPALRIWWRGTKA